MRITNWIVDQRILLPIVSIKFGTASLQIGSWSSWVLDLHSELAASLPWNFNHLNYPQDVTWGVVDKFLIWIKSLSQLTDAKIFSGISMKIYSTERIQNFLTSQTLHGPHIRVFSMVMESAEDPKLGCVNCLQEKGSRLNYICLVDSFFTSQKGPFS